MSSTVQPAKLQHFANLDALQRQLREMAARTKRTGGTEREACQEYQGPVLVIRGK